MNKATVKFAIKIFMNLITKEDRRFKIGLH
jgi:hypothetical protein